MEKIRWIFLRVLNPSRWVFVNVFYTFPIIDRIKSINDNIDNIMFIEQINCFRLEKLCPPGGGKVWIKTCQYQTHSTKNLSRSSWASLRHPSPSSWTPAFCLALSLSIHSFLSSWLHCYISWHPLLFDIDIQPHIWHPVFIASVS